MTNMTQLAIDMISSLGYGGLFLGLFLDSFGPPIPSEILVPLATVLTMSGRFEPWAVFAVATAGQVTGATAGYLVGRYGGEPLVERYGKYVLLTKHDLNRAHRAFERYGTWLVLAGRCVPGIRGVIAYPAGVAEMRLGPYVIYTLIGSAVWSLLLMQLGYLVGRNMDLMDSLAHKFSLAGIVVLVALLGWYISKHWNKLKRVLRRGAAS